MKNIALVILGIILGIFVCYIGHTHQRISELEMNVKLQEYKIEQLEESILVHSEAIMKLLNARLVNPQNKLQLL